MLKLSIFCFLLFDLAHAEAVPIDKLLTLPAEPEETVCFTSECVLIASRLRSWMNPAADPCENFYKYACGGFLADTCLNDSEAKVTPFTMAYDRIGQQLVKVLEEPSAGDELAPFRVFKTIFARCKQDEGVKISVKGLFVPNFLFSFLFLETFNLDEVENMTAEYQEWENNEQFDWVNATVKLRKAGLPFEILFSVSVTRDQRNTSTKLLKVRIDQ